MDDRNLFGPSYFTNFSVYIIILAFITALIAFVFKTWSSFQTTTMSDGAASETAVSDESLPVVEKKVLVLGLDGAGKSSLLMVLGKQDIEETPSPTTGFNVINVQTDNTTLYVWELGGQENVRQYWSNFFADTTLLVFVLDSTASDRFGEARSELTRVLQDEKLQQLPVVLVANKQDLVGAKSVEDIEEAFDLTSIPSHEFHIVATQVPQGQASKGVEDLEKYITAMDA